MSDARRTLIRAIDRIESHIWQTIELIVTSADAEEAAEYSEQLDHLDTGWTRLHDLLDRLPSNVTI